MTHPFGAEYTSSHHRVQCGQMSGFCQQFVGSMSGFQGYPTRRYCPFYEFQIDYHAADGSIWLSVTGRPGVKEYLPVDSPRLASKLPK